MTAEVLSPRTLEEALRALEGADERTLLLAGGTDLMVELRTGRATCDRLVDIWGLPELRGITEEGEALRLGGLTTCADLLRSPLARRWADILVQAAGEVGAVQIQNRATLAGNLGTASPAADLAPIFLVLGARLRLVSGRGAREVPIEDFFTGYRRTARAADELIEAILLPPRPAAELRLFRKVGTRSAQSISKVVVALAAVIEGGVLRSLRAAAGSVAERTVLLPTLEGELVGKPLDAARIESATRLAVRSDCAPIDDVRSTADYRRLVLQRVLADMLRGAIAPPSRREKT